MRKLIILLYLLASLASRAQHDHNANTNDNQQSGHLAHIQASRTQTVYIHNLPPPKLMNGVGQSGLQIETASDKTQQYFNQGVSLLHDFWDFEAYRAFKEAIRHDSSAIMPYWGLLQTVGNDEDSMYKQDKELALRKLKALKDKATEHEKLYAEGVLLQDSVKEKGWEEYNKKLELIVHKFQEDVDAKLFLAIRKMGGYDTDLNPREGQIYAEYLLRDVLRTHPEHHALHHYWIHLKENCCPEQALESAGKLPSLAPKSGHIVHMPGHIYYKLGDYKKAYEAFKAAVLVDSAYMKDQGIQEVDNWNYIHNINYLLASCAQDGRHTEGLYYAQKLKNMPITSHRKKIYQGSFFNQGTLAPARMEIAFGFWDKALRELKIIEDKDSAYGAQNMKYKEGLQLFAAAMNALTKNKIQEAVNFSYELDAHLWRTTNQTEKKDELYKYTQNRLNVASLELQGNIKSAQGKYDEAVKLLEAAQKKEKALGYGEPPTYARPVYMSLAAAHERAAKWDKAIEAYGAVLKQHPNSAYALHGVAKTHRKKGDKIKAAEYEKKLNEVIQYGDKHLYAGK